MFLFLVEQLFPGAIPLKSKALQQQVPTSQCVSKPDPASMDTPGVHHKVTPSCDRPVAEISFKEKPGTHQPCTAWTQMSRPMCQGGVQGGQKMVMAAMSVSEQKGLDFYWSIMCGLGRFWGLCTERLQYIAVICSMRVLFCFPGIFLYKPRKRCICKSARSACASSCCWRSSPVTPLTRSLPQLISSKPRRHFLDHDTES